VNYLKKTIGDFIDDDCTTQAAALAYYTLFALPPLLLVIISMVGLFFGRQAAEGKIQGQIQGLLGPEAAAQAETMVQKANEPHSAGVAGAALGSLALLFGATGAFVQLQTSLDRIWRVKPDPAKGGIRNLITQRIFSFGTVVAMGLLLLVSLAVSTVIEAVGSTHGAGISKGSLLVMESAGSFLIIWGLFATVFKLLPDAHIQWRQVWVGALVTAALFTVGKYLISSYLGKTAMASAYGQAGSLVLIVLWIYYSSIIVLLGAEFTRVWTEAHGDPVEPKEGAVRYAPRQKLRPARAA
jgi:membrane protein